MTEPAGRTVLVGVAAWRAVVDRARRGRRAAGEDRGRTASAGIRRESSREVAIARSGMCCWGREWSGVVGLRCGRRPSIVSKSSPLRSRRAAANGRAAKH